MGYIEDRDNRRVRGGEEIADAIADALRLRDPQVVSPDDRSEHTEYRHAMMVLLGVFEQLARDEINQREMDLSYDG
jgi:hypothetical protein